MNKEIANGDAHAVTLLSEVMHMYAIPVSQRSSEWVERHRILFNEIHDYFASRDTAA